MLPPSASRLFFNLKINIKMAKRMEILKTVKLSPQNKYKVTRKFMGHIFNFWSASQRYTCKNTATSNSESEGRV